MARFGSKGISRREPPQERDPGESAALDIDEALRWRVIGLPPGAIRGCELDGSLVRLHIEPAALAETFFHQPFRTELILAVASVLGPGLQVWIQTEGNP